jgi:hypothetical protein
MKRPGRRGCCHPRPPQSRTCRFPASGSSRERFADGIADGHSYAAILRHRDSLIEGQSCLHVSAAIHVVSLTGFVGLVVPSRVSRHGSLLATPPFPPSGPSEPGSPLVTGTMKALRLPTCVSMVTYLVRFHCPHDPPGLCPPQRSWEVGGSFQARALGYRPPVFPVVSRGRRWDLSGLQAIHPVPLLRSSTPVEPTCPRP